MKRILFLGDSITDANHCFEPENLGFGYVREISSALPADSFQIINRGNDGFTVPSVLRLWKNSANTLQPDLISLLIGINDLSVIKCTGITESVGLANFRTQLETLFCELRNSCSCPILILEPFIFPRPLEYAAWEPALKKLCEILSQTAAAYELDFLPLWEDLQCAAKLHGYQKLTTDGIHLTAFGHELIAKKWLEYYSSAF